jgi:UDP-N-acetylmuramate--alanine ligase
MNDQLWFESEFDGIPLSLAFMDDNGHTTAHFVGACGAGMRALAEVLLDRGWLLSGSDLSSPNSQMQKLVDRGLALHQGHSEANLPQSVQMVVYSPAIPSRNVERQLATQRHLPQFSYSQMVGQLMRSATGVCVAGTHGKSTTTAMTASILERAGRLEAVVLGAELRDGGRSGWSGSGDLFVAESCEFQKSFLDFHSRYTAILSIEPDHFDCYPDLKSLQSAFTAFAEQTSPDGVLLVNAECPVSQNVSSNASICAKRVSFGLNESADWQAKRIETTPQGIQFQLFLHGDHVIEIELPLHGHHNLENSLAAAAFCAEIGVLPDVIRDSLANFRGIRRRFEFVGEWNGILFVDDYAHHPTAVKVTLETLRNVVGNRRIRCVFQPHQVLRTKTLMTDFASSFTHANDVLVAPVFAARESVSNEPFAVSQELADRISANGVSARFFPSLDQIVTTLDDAARPGDVIVTMGAGDIDRINHEFTRRIQ